MYEEGHVGVALLLLAPVAFVGSYLGFLALVGLATAGVVALCTLPDVDVRLPFVRHRGITHTFLAAGVVGAAVGTGAWGLTTAGADVGALLPGSPLGSAVTAFAVGFAVGAFAVTAHIAGDVLTPMGVEPFYPFSNTTYTVDLVRASNRLANGAFLLFGGAVWVGAVVAGILARNDGLAAVFTL